MSSSQEGFVDALEAALDVVLAREPAAGKVASSDVVAVRRAVTAVEDALAAQPEVPDAYSLALVTIYMRAAALAHAAGEVTTAQLWLTTAREHARDELPRALVSAATAQPERYRQLAHARYQFANGQERAARAACKRLVREDKRDAIAIAARAELAAVRPLRGGGPTLFTLNGFGLRFYGRRDEGGDGRYTTTHCLTALFVPLFAVGAYRVRDDYGGGYEIFGRAPLSAFARWARVGLVVGVLALIAGISSYRYFNDPERLARHRFDAALAAADDPDREAALARLDQQLAGPDVDRVDVERRERVGAAIVRITAAMVPRPLTPAHLDQVQRVIRRYRDLPPAARAGVAMAELQTALEAWIAEMKPYPDAELALVREAEALARAGADRARAAAFAARSTELRLQLAERLATTEPTAALWMLMAPPATDETIAAAEPIVIALAAAPSLLEDEPAGVEAWLARRQGSDPVRAQVISAREQAASVRAAAEREGVTAAELAQMARERPWDQRVILAQAQREVDAGKLDQAAARLRAVGADGHLIRDGRGLLASIELQLGRPEVADEILTAILTPRLPRYLEAAYELDAAVATVERSIEGRLRTGAIPDSLRRELERPLATDESRRVAVTAWANTIFEADPPYRAAQAKLAPLADVVPTALGLGSIKLRRAQAATDATREAFLRDAERAFLSIRAAAEGQPSFHLGLGEIYARLGKHEASEAEFAGVIAKGDPMLTLDVADIYRSIGSTARAIEVATKVYDTSTGPPRSTAALIMYQLTLHDEATSERWLQAADPSIPFVQQSKLELKARQQMRQGDWQACAATLDEAADRALSTASVTNVAGYNNSAVAYLQAYQCSGDVGLLRRAEDAMARAYRVAAQQPIVVGNYASLLHDDAALRELRRHVDVEALRLSGDLALSVLNLVDGGEALRDRMMADPKWRRGRELAAQFLLLSPNNPSAYEWAFEEAAWRGDAAAASTEVERLRRAEGLDTSAATSVRERAAKGELDARRRETAAVTIQRMTEVIDDPKASPRTRALAYAVRGWTRAERALIDGAVADAQGCVADHQAAQGLWPQLRLEQAVIGCAVDQIALGDRDAATWRSERRRAGALATLLEVGDRDAGRLARYQADPTWAVIEATAPKVRGVPSVDDIRLARLFPAVAERGAAARRDPILRLRTEFAYLADPNDPALAASQALLAAP